jgi:hypothetical protein
MPIKTIKKEKHRAWPPSIGVFFKKESISKRVCFLPSCEYELDHPDRYDFNKLFGIGYCNNLLQLISIPFNWLLCKIKKKKFIPPHQIDSVRIGWRYNWITNKIATCAYCYVRGSRVDWLLSEMEFNKDYIVGIVITKDKYHFIVLEADSNKEISHDTVAKFHQKKWGYRLGVHFGGNKTAPHKMQIKIQNA